MLPPHAFPVQRLILLGTFLAPAFALAHDPGGSPDPWRWNIDPWLVVPLAIAAGIYAAGCVRLARRAGSGRGIGARQHLAFAVGWLLLAVALLSPVDTLGAELFWVHMVQHELLMGVAAPLLVLSRPLEAFAWGLPRAWTVALARAARGPSLAWLVLSVRPAVAFTLHALAIWLWHIPALFDLALVDEDIHSLQHASFFGTGLAFWHSAWRHGRRSEGVALASLFATMVHMGVLGALLTFAGTPWYAFRATAAFGLTALEDQQLGGLLMWVPGAIPYLAAALVILARHLQGPPSQAESTLAQPLPPAKPQDRHAM